VSQLGAGFGSGFPTVIDTVQTWRNGVLTAPDSDTRVDAEFMNDVTLCLRAIQMALGANPQGIFGSVAARLNQFLPGTIVITNLFNFTNVTSVTLPGSVHQLGTPAILPQVYDASSPAAAMEPDAITVDPTSYDVTATFVTPQSGTLVVGAAAPQYVTAFTAQTTVTILGSTHGLATANLFYAVYDDATPRNWLSPGKVTVHASTFDVVITFNDVETGTIILSAQGPQYTASFTSATSVIIAGTTHGLATRALLYQVWNAATPREAVEPDSVLVDAGTFDVHLAFSQPQSGSVVLAVAGQISGTDFEIRDGGIANSTATRVYSELGDLSLQQGGAHHLYIRSNSGAVLMTVDGSGNLGLGTSTPTYQLQLSTDSASKPGSSTWTVASDARLKEVKRPFTDGLAVALQMSPVVYVYNGLGGIAKSPREYIGTIAQAVQEVAPYLVTSSRGKLHPKDETETDILGYDGNAMSFILLNAIRELHEKIVALETINHTLATAVADLAARLDGTEALP
jgi:hypothetical protein